MPAFGENNMMDYNDIIENAVENEIDDKENLSSNNFGKDTSKLGDSQ